MKKLLLAATGLAVLAGPAYATDWWRMSNHGAFNASCEREEPGKSPAEAFKTFSMIMNPKLIDNGDEVIIRDKSQDLDMYFYRNERTCRDALSRINADAAAADKKLDPYR
jgi:hypothetical protein